MTDKMMNPVAKYLIVGSSLAVNAYVRKDYVLDYGKKRQAEKKEMIEHKRAPVYTRVRTPVVRPRILQGDLPAGDLAGH